MLCCFGKKKSRKVAVVWENKKKIKSVEITS